MEGEAVCVLLVDDNLLMRQVMAAALRRVGYEAEDVSDGHAAVAMFDERPEQFTILVTNFQLPGSYDGRDIAEHVRKSRPGLPVLIASGSQEALSASWHRDGGFSVLPKPYRARELLRLVGEMTKRAEGQL